MAITTLTASDLNHVTLLHLYHSVKPVILTPGGGKPAMFGVSILEPGVAMHCMSAIMIECRPKTEADCGFQCVRGGGGESQTKTGAADLQEAP